MRRHRLLRSAIKPRDDMDTNPRIISLTIHQLRYIIFFTPQKGGERYVPKGRHRGQVPRGEARCTKPVPGRLPLPAERLSSDFPCLPSLITI